MWEDKEHTGYGEDKEHGGKDHAHVEKKDIFRQCEEHVCPKQAHTER